MRLLLHNAFILSVALSLGLPSPHALAQQSTQCRKKLRQKDYKGAIGCFHKLYKKYPKKLSFLRNQAVIFRMWSDANKAKNPGLSCFLLKRSLKVYGALRDKAEGVTRLKILARITKLQGKLGLTSLSISTTPEGATVEVKGFRYSIQKPAPQVLTGLCPGTYSIKASKAGHKSLTRRVLLLPGKPQVQTFRLPTTRGPKTPSACPPNITSQVGPWGCPVWSACRKGTSKACRRLAKVFKNQGDTLQQIQYLSLSCNARHGPSCFEVADIYESTSRLDGSYDYFRRGCTLKHAISCQRLGDLYAGRFANRRLKRQQKKRICSKAIVAYSRACKYGRKTSCRKACNTLNVLPPILIHSVAHLGSLILGGVLLSRNESSIGAIAFSGGLALIGTLPLILLWKQNMEVHSLGWMLLNSATVLIPTALGLTLIGASGGKAPLFLPEPKRENFPSDAAYNQKKAVWDRDGPLHSAAALGWALLLIVLPVQIMWTAYGWIHFKQHRDTVDAGETGKIKLSFQPYISPQGAGFAIGGVF